VLVPGHRADAPLIDSGTWIGDGQARALPFTLVWARHVPRAEQWSSIGCVSSLGIGSVGIARLLPEGNPLLPPAFDPRLWTALRLAESLRRIHTWEQGVVGPNKNSDDAGAQQDQTFVAGESLVRNGCGAERITLLGGYRMASRPCHHLELNGHQVDASKHPQLVYWDGRVHWNDRVSPDRLGKSGGELVTDGWLGPDVEHAFCHVTIAAGRLTGSPLVQHLMEAQARVFRLQWTTDPALIYQSVPFAARAVGWEADLALGLWRNLEDRMLAEATKAHWLDRATKVLVPQLGSLPGDLWDWRRDDRIGPGVRWMPWQQGVGAYFLVLAGDVSAIARSRRWGARCSRGRARAYWLNGKEWTARDVVAQDGAAVPSGAYDYFGTPPRSPRSCATTRAGRIADSTTKVRVQTYGPKSGREPRRPCGLATRAQSNDGQVCAVPVRAGWIFNAQGFVAGGLIDDAAASQRTPGRFEAIYNRRLKEAQDRAFIASENELRGLGDREAAAMRDRELGRSPLDVRPLRDVPWGRTVLDAWEADVAMAKAELAGAKAAASIQLFISDGGV
jgi:hypothetical protein